MLRPLQNQRLVLFLILFDMAYMIDLKVVLSWDVGPCWCHMITLKLGNRASALASLVELYTLLGFHWQICNIIDHQI